MPSSRRGSFDLGEVTMELPVRKHPRMKEYNYANAGCYFLTFCVKGHKCCLGDVIAPIHESELPEVILSETGQITKEAIERIPNVYQDVVLDSYAVMPNHVHLLMTLGSAAETSIPMIVRAVKTAVSRSVGMSIWQDSYYDHVVRNQREYEKIWNYISSNAAKWMEDRYFKS